jgi:hypothetical protein
LKIKELKKTSVYVCLLFINFIQSQTNLKEVQLDLKQNVLSKNKVLKVENQVYYNLVNGELITHNVKPIESYIFTNTKGEMKVYDPQKNTIVLSQSPEQSSETSFFSLFFSNAKSDFNLKKLGFEIEKTEVNKDKNIVTTWKNTKKSKKVMRAKMVQENFLPIFLGFYNDKNEAVIKIYYTDYIKIDKFQLPLKITEISIIEQKKDSIIDRRIYSNVKMNNEIDLKLKQYKIPENAQITKP